MIFLSASQINQYRDCARKWGFSYLANIKTPQHPAAALGTEVDDTQLQPYLRDGRPFDYSRESQSGYIAASILAYLPQPKTPGMQIQQFFEMPGPTWSEERDFGYRGYLDCFLPESSALPDIEGGRPAVVDFKTTGNFRYAKTPETLATDVQAQLYATHAMFTTGAREVDLVWLYMQTKGPRKAKRVHLRVTSSHVAEQFENINTTAVEMYGLRKTYEANHTSDRAEEFVLDSLPPNPDMCETYGGCPFRSKCNLSPDQIVDAHAAKYEALRTLGTISMSNSNPTEDLLAGLRKRQAAPAATITAPAVEQIAEDIAPQQASAPPAWATASVPPKALGINPPESLLPPAPPIGSAPVALQELRPLLDVAEPKAKGRPKGSKNATKEVSTYNPVEELAGLSEYELRADAVRELAKTVGDALSRFAAQLEVSK